MECDTAGLLEDSAVVLSPLRLSGHCRISLSSVCTRMCMPHKGVHTPCWKLYLYCLESTGHPRSGIPCLFLVHLEVTCLWMVECAEFYLFFKFLKMFNLIFFSHGSQLRLASFSKGSLCSPMYLQSHLCFAAGAPIFRRMDSLHDCVLKFTNIVQSPFCAHLNINLCKQHGCFPGGGPFRNLSQARLSPFLSHKTWSHFKSVNMREMN